MPTPQQSTQSGGWNVVSTAPAQAGAWDVVSAQPVQQATPKPAATPTQGSSLFGPHPLASAINTAKTVGSHVAGNVSGTYHALTDAPQGTAESLIDTLLVRCRRTALWSSPPSTL